jgi:hypothetical protein
MPTRDENVPVGNEHPDPDTPPTPAAPGSVGLRKSPEHGHGQFQEAYDAAPDEVVASGSIAHDDDDDEDEEPTAPADR